jgi:hypothetical protein
MTRRVCVGLAQHLRQIPPILANCKFWVSNLDANEAQPLSGATIAHPRAATAAS